MDNALKVFSFESNRVRVIDKDGEPWFVAKDVCDVLGVSNAREALSGLEDDERGNVRISDGTSPQGGNPNMNIISESGLYTLIMRSNKPESRRFRKWVTAEVLPAIRKQGVYLTDQKAVEFLTNPDSIMTILQNWKADRDRKIELEVEAKENEPLVLFAKSLQVSDSSILVGNLAKILKQNGIEIGGRRLFNWLREKCYLMKQPGENWNLPTQRSMEMGLFEVKRSVINNPDGTTRVTTTTKVTTKGQVYFVNLFLKEKAA